VDAAPSASSRDLLAGGCPVCPADVVPEFMGWLAYTEARKSRI